MYSAAALRIEIENTLAKRIPGALTPRTPVVRDLASTGVVELDALLDGGFPVGAISELVGLPCSGRTTLAFAVMAEMTQAGKTVAWVDASDALDPESAAAAGIDLSRQLWVRCGEGASATHVPPSPLQNPDSQGATYRLENSRTPGISGGCGSPHPRGEARGLSDAVDAFLHPDVFSRPAPPRDPAKPRRDRMIGTPSAPNRKLIDRTPQDARPLPRRARNREEQIATDRQPSRRHALQIQRHATAQAKDLAAAQIANTAEAARVRPQAGAWTDNKGNASGRSLATPPHAIAAGLPRFQQAADRTRTLGTRCELNQSAPHQGFQVHRSNGSSCKVERPEREALRNSHGLLVSRQVKTSKGVPAGKALPASSGPRSSPAWRALDQALRSTDLLLTAGGFSAVVLDLGNVAPEFAWRIPLATWFRFRAAAERSRAVLLLLTRHPCARSSAELVLRLHPVQVHSKATVVTGARFRIAIERRRFETVSPIAEDRAGISTLHLVSRKPVQRERAVGWHRHSTWTSLRQQSVQRDSR